MTQWAGLCVCAVCVESLFSISSFFSFWFSFPVCVTWTIQSISAASIFCCVDLAYRKRDDWSCRSSSLLLTLSFFPSPIFGKSRTRPSHQMMSYRPVRPVLTPPPRPQHLSHRKNSTKWCHSWRRAQKKKKSLYTGLGAIRSIWFCLVDFFHEFIKTKTVVVGEEKKKIKKKNITKNQTIQRYWLAAIILEKSKVLLPSALANVRRCWKLWVYSLQLSFE